MSDIILSFHASFARMQSRNTWLKSSRFINIDDDDNIMR